MEILGAPRFLQSSHVIDMLRSSIATVIRVWSSQVAGLRRPAFCSVRPQRAPRVRVAAAAEEAPSSSTPFVPVMEWPVDNESFKDVFAFAGSAPEVRRPFPRCLWHGCVDEAVEGCGMCACSAMHLPFVPYAPPCWVCLAACHLM